MPKYNAQALLAYEELVLGKISTSGKKKFTLSGSDREKEEAAKSIFRYVITELLKWTPEEAQEHLTTDLMRSLHLDVICDSNKQYLRFPPDLVVNEDYDYMVSYCFDLPYDYRRQLLRQYKRILRGEVPKFHKDCFKGSFGRDKIAYLMHYFIAKTVPASSVENLYEIFANSAAMNKRLKAANLYSAYHNLYTTPLEAMHYSLPDDTRDDFLFNFHRYIQVYKECEKSMKKEKALTQAEADE